MFGYVLLLVIYIFEIFLFTCSWSIWALNTKKFLKVILYINYLALKHYMIGIIDHSNFLELEMEQHTGSKLGKEYVEAVYCHPAYLAYMQSTSGEMLDWVKHKLDCSTPGLPVHLKLPEFTQTQVHWVSDAIHLSHPLLSPSPPALNLSQHQGLFKSVSSSHLPT